MSNYLAKDLSLLTGSQEAYFKAVGHVPMLTAEQEYELAEQLQSHGDLNAAKSLVLAHLRFVIYIARGYSGYGLPLADLIQEGNVGLMKAVKRFDPTVKVRLVSFAVHWIRAEIHEFILRNWRIVKVATTKAQRKLFFNLRSSKKRLGWFNQEEVKAVAKDLGVAPKDVMEMESRLSGLDTSFDATDADDDNDAYTPAPAAFLQDKRTDPAISLEVEDWRNHNTKNLRLVLHSLDERSRDILEKRWLSENKSTLHDLAKKYNVSAERIRQLESNAMKKLKSALDV